LLPVLTSVTDPWTYKTIRTSPLLVEKVKALRAEGKELKEIASLVDLHWVTVGKICRGMKKGKARYSRTADVPPFGREDGDFDSPK
jgi:hypothetical protein